MTNTERRNQKIVNLFTGNEKTISQLSLMFKISKERVRQILVEEKINIKQLRDEKEAQILSRMQTVIEENPHFSRLQIANLLNLSLFKIKNLIKKFGVKLDRSQIASNAKLIYNHKNSVKLTKEILYQLYTVEKKTLRQIAEHLDCHPATAARYLKRFHIPARPKGRPSPKKNVKR